MLIIVEQDTPLKFKLDQSFNLNESQQLLLAKGTELNLQKVQEEKGHLATNFYLWEDHWDVTETNPVQPNKNQKGLERQLNNPAAIQRQIDRLTAYVPEGKKLNLDFAVNYADQRDNRKGAHRTCNTSSNAMYLDWLLRVTGKPKGLGIQGNGTLNDNHYLTEVFKRGDTIYHRVQTQTIKHFGFKTKWMTDADFPFIIDLLVTGFPVVANILHRGSVNAPRGGHVLCLIGFKHGVFLAHDPYGTLESNYSNTNGKFSKIHRTEFQKRWQGGYRILA